MSGRDLSRILKSCPASVSKGNRVSAIIEEPLAPPKDMLYERVNGRFVEKRMSALALMLATKLCVLMSNFASTRRLGHACNEMVFILDVEHDLRRRPDVAFVSAGRWPVDRLPPWDSDWPVVPDLAVEIVCPTNTMRDMMRKLAEYFRHGVAEVWIVLPEERQVHCYSDPKTVRILDAADDLSTPLLPGWTHPLAAWLPVFPTETPPAPAAPSA